MKIEYQKFIDDNYSTYEECYGNCHQACRIMQEQFPELITVKGWVFCSWGQRDHSWLIDKEGNIVDPTAKQFTRISKYKAWEPGMEVCVGRCINCGKDIWKAVQSLEENVKDKSICSEECAKSFEIYMQKEMDS